MIIRRIAIAAVVLALGTVPARAGSVTYDFIEGQFSPNPGMVGAILTFASPPAYANMPWTTSANADILSFQITDPAMVPVGSYVATIAETVVSTSGGTLDSGIIDGNNAGFLINTIITSTPDSSYITNVNEATSFPGDWVVSSSIPEPSSLIQAGIAALASLGIWTRRR